MGINRLVAVLLLALLSPASAQRQRAKSHEQATASAAAQAQSVAEAEALLGKGQFAPAAEKLQVAVAQDANNPQAWFDLGFAESHLGDAQQSIAAYRKAVELSPKWFEANLNLGLALAVAGNSTEAAAILKNAVTLQPTNGGKQVLSRAWSALAQVLEQSQPQEALADYRKAIELDPSVSENLQATGRLLEHTGDVAGAEQQYRQAAFMGNGAAVEQLVTLYLKEKRLPDAENWLHKYLQDHPQDVQARTQLGKVLAAEGKVQEAISALEAGNNTSDLDVARELSLLYMENKQYDQAARLLQRLSQNSPSDAELHYNYGEALLHQHKYPEAEAELIRALQINFRLAEAYADLAFAAGQNKHYELAIRVLDARAKYLPETAGTYWLRATSYDNLRAYPRAIQNYKLFLAASGGKAPDQEFQARHRLKALQPN